MQYGFTTNLKNDILNNYFVKEESSENPIYVGLLLGEGQPDEVLVELVIDTDGTVGTHYQRAPVHFSLANNGYVANTSDIIFNQAAIDWTSNTKKIVAVGIYDGNTVEDNCLAVLPLSDKEDVLGGQTFTLNPQAVRIQLV